MIDDIKAEQRVLEQRTTKWQEHLDVSQTVSALYIAIKLSNSLQIV